MENTQMELLLLSNSTNYGQSYMEHAKKEVQSFLKSADNIVFIPYAGVTIDYNTYTAKVKGSLPELADKIRGIHTFDHPRDAIKNADAVAVGGGNTFHLLHELYRHDLIDLIKEKVASGMKYVGWSAGSNVAGLTICTTNDMPIIEPPSFRALQLIPFQINPHYTEESIPNHGGETRADRILEYVKLPTSSEVLCLPEGTWIRRTGEEYILGNSAEIKVFSHPDKVHTWNSMQLTEAAERIS
jgi:dipeptidase E